MEIIRGLHNLRAAHRGCVLAVGNFDGVHLGHQALLQRLRAHAEEHDLPAVVQSFRPTAAAYFSGDAAPPAVLPLRDTLQALQSCGVQRWSCLRFDARFAEFSAERYIREVLLDGLAIRALVVGEDFRFGAGRKGNVAMLRRAGAEHGFHVDGVGQVCDADARVSSTRLRAALAEGDLSAVEALIGREYALSGPVRHGQQLGRRIGTPTANLRFRDRLALRHGVYAVHIEAEGETQPELWPGVANFGVRPTVGGDTPVLEAHALADVGALYGRQLRIVFRQFIRDECRFASIDALTEQIGADKAAARAALGITTT